MGVRMRTALMGTMALAAVSIGLCEETLEQVPTPAGSVDVDQITAHFGENPEDLSRMVELTMSMTRTGQVDGQSVTVIWNPPAMERAVLANNPYVTPSEADELGAFLDENFMRVTVMNISAMSNRDETGNPLGGLDGRIQVRAPDGTLHGPMGSDEVPPEVGALMEMDMSGVPEEERAEAEAFADNLQIFTFPSVADPTQPGAFSVIIDGVEFTWELPIAAFLPLRVCPECGEEYPGDYRFCPHHGVELVSP